MTNQVSRAPISLVTGANRGLGRSMVLKLAEQGSDVILTYRSNRAEADAVVAALVAMGRRAVALPLDVAVTSGFAAFAGQVQHVLATWQRDGFDHLVNNAGTGLHKAFMETTEAEFDEQMNTHLKGTFFLTQALLPLMVDGGRIVNVSSGLARFSFPGSSAYAIMKGGVEVLTRYLARELGERRITVNTIAPGAIATDFRGGAVRDNPDMQKAIAAQTALGRVGQPDDIGGVVASLLSPANGWINGQRIEASGGMVL